MLGFLALSLGDAEAAVRHLGPLREAEARLGIAEPAHFCIAPDLAEALVLAGDLDAAREVQAELEDRGRPLGLPWTIATGLRCRGLMSAAEGEPAVALVSSARRSARAPTTTPGPSDRARARLALGSVQRRAKQRAERATR